MNREFREVAIFKVGTLATDLHLVFRCWRSYVPFVFRPWKLRINRPRWVVAIVFAPAASCLGSAWNRNARAAETIVRDLRIQRGSFLAKAAARCASALLGRPASPSCSSVAIASMLPASCHCCANIRRVPCV